MLILINEKYKAIRTGEYVIANPDSKEFVLDTDLSESTPTLSVLSEIATANKVVFGKRQTKAELLDLIETHVSGMKLPTQNEKPDSLKVKEIVDAAQEEGVEDEDAVLMQIIQAGVSFKNALKLYKQAMIDGGYLVTTKDRTTQCRAILVKAGFEPNEWDEVNEMIERLVKEVPATETSQAYAQIRKYAKEFDIVLPKPEKKVSAGGFKAKIYAYMVKKPLATRDQFFAWIVEDNEKEEKLAEKYWEVFELAQKVAKATIALDE